MNDYPSKRKIEDAVKIKICDIINGIQKKYQEQFRLEVAKSLETIKKKADEEVVTQLTALSVNLHDVFNIEQRYGPYIQELLIKVQITDKRS